MDNDNLAKMGVAMIKMCYMLYEEIPSSEQIKQDYIHFHPDSSSHFDEPQLFNVACTVRSFFWTLKTMS